MDDGEAENEARVHVCHYLPDREVTLECPAEPVVSGWCRQPPLLPWRGIVVSWWFGQPHERDRVGGPAVHRTLVEVGVDYRESVRVQMDLISGEVHMLRALAKVIDLQGSGQATRSIYSGMPCSVVLGYDFVTSRPRIVIEH